MTLWLTNCDKKRRKSRQSTELSTPPGKPLEHRRAVSGEDLIATYYANLARSAESAEPDPGAERPDLRVVRGGQDPDDDEEYSPR